MSFAFCDHIFVFRWSGGSCATRSHRPSPELPKVWNCNDSKQWTERARLRPFSNVVLVSVMLIWFDFSATVIWLGFIHGILFSWALDKENWQVFVQINPRYMYMSTATTRTIYLKNNRILQDHSNGLRFANENTSALKQVNCIKFTNVQKWWHSPPTNMSRVRFPDSRHVGWVCFCFSSFLREVFFWVLRFSPFLKTNIFKFPHL